MNRACIYLMTFGAMIFWLPMISDPYMTPRLLLVTIGASALLFMKSERRSSLEGPVLTLLAAAIVSSVFAQDKFYAVVGSYQFGMDSLIAFACYFFVLAASARAEGGVDDITRTIVIASIPMSMYGIFQRFFKDPLIWRDLHGGTRVASTQGGPIFLGAVLAVVVVCCAPFVKKGDRLARVALALAALTILFTQTRGAILAAIIGSTFITRWALVASIPAIFLVPRIYTSGLSDITRVEVWKTALRVFIDHPWTGYGPGNFYLAFRRYTNWDLVDIVGSVNYVQAHAHNDILHVLATMGIIGFVAYILLGYSVVRVALMHTERKLLLGILAAYAVLSSFNPVTTSAFVLMAMIFGAASSKITASAKRRASPALASMIVTLFTGRLILADYHYVKGYDSKDDIATQAMEFQEAARLNPFEMFYTCRQIDSLMGLIPRMPVEQRSHLALAGRDLAVMALRRHPMDSYAHELMGKQIIIGHMAGYRDVDPREAMNAFNRAQELAPTFEALMWRRLATANGLKDGEQIWRANQDIATLRHTLLPGRRS